MKRAVLAACLGFAASACAEDYYGSYGYGGGGRYEYDDFYRPYYGGYPGYGGFYAYPRGRPFVHDHDHFRRYGGDHFHGMHGGHGDFGHPGGRSGDHHWGYHHGGDRGGGDHHWGDHHGGDHDRGNRH